MWVQDPGMKTLRRASKQNWKIMKERRGDRMEDLTHYLFQNRSIVLNAQKAASPSNLHGKQISLGIN